MARGGAGQQRWSGPERKSGSSNPSEPRRLGQPAVQELSCPKRVPFWVTHGDPGTRSIQSDFSLTVLTSFKVHSKGIGHAVWCSSPCPACLRPWSSSPAPDTHTKSFHSRSRFGIFNMKKGTELLTQLRVHRPARLQTPQLAGLATLWCGHRPRSLFPIEWGAPESGRCTTSQLPSPGSGPH